MWPVKTKEKIKKIFHAVGLDIRRYSAHADYTNQRSRYLLSAKVVLLFDVGGSDGRYGLIVREHGYSNQIISFEPLPSSYGALSKNASRDDKWDVSNIALSNQIGVAEFHVANNQSSSSLRGMLDLHKTAGNVTISKAIQVQTQSLDGFMENYRLNDSPCFLKLDVQGAEDMVLQGARETLKRCAGLEIELSLDDNLYDGQSSWLHLASSIERKGFRPLGVETVFCHPTDFRTLQINMLYGKK
jgi:FkbM family methyltransferase